MATNEKQTDTVFKTKTPFTLTKATYQNWYGGVKGVKGVKIVILGKDLEKNIVFKTLYYKGKKANIIVSNKENKLVLRVDINTSTREERLILHGDSQREYGNKPPVKSKYPNLKEHEAIIVYLQKEKELFVKINLKKEMDLLYQ